MKNVLDWAKTNWAIVVLSVVALTALPAGLVVAGSMNASLREEVSKKVNDDYKNVTASKVEYGIPDPAGTRVLTKMEDVREPATAWYRDRWNETKARIDTIGPAAVEFNRRGRGPLIEGIFPAPEQVRNEFLRRDFVRAYIQAHRRILDEINAGAPPAPPEIAQQLTDYQTAFIEEARQRTGAAELEPAEKEKLTKDLIDQRVGRYRQRALEISVYATPDVFAAVPAAVPDVPPSLPEIWDLQERLWIHEDIARAVGLANGSSGDGGVPDSTVKRILAVDVENQNLPTPSDAGAPGDMGAGTPGADLAPRDFTKSITGRVAGPGSGNKWYDLRRVQLSVVISSQRLPAFVDALAQANFMSVVDMDLYRVDPLDHLKQGYFYGDEHVVRADLTIEHALLREWRRQWMPAPVKQALGVEDPPPADGSVPDTGDVPPDPNAPGDAPPGSTGAPRPAPGEQFGGG